MVGYLVLIGVLGLSILLPVKGILWFVNVEERVILPPDLLGCGHWVRILLFRHCGQHFQLLFQGVHRLLVFLLDLAGAHLVDGGWLVGDDQEVLWVEVEVLIQDSAS